jgi:hypothetical protein
MIAGVKLLRKPPGFLFIAADQRDEPGVFGIPEGR